jgi:hypothetical protein
MAKSCSIPILADNIRKSFDLEAMSKAEIDDARIRTKEARDKNSHNPFGETW